MYSIFDLSFTFIERFYDEEPPKEEKIQIIRDFEELLIYGWTLDEIQKVLRTFIAKHPNVRPDIPKLFSKVNCKRANLLTQGVFYYHNQLRITPGPPKRDLDYNTGEIIRIDEEFFLEIRASYTIDDLADYYIYQLAITPSVQERTRLIGAIRYLLKQYPIDLLLFMIDQATNYLQYGDKSRRDYNPLNLSDYRGEAEGAMNEKATETKLSGDDRIVPRKRVFTFRSRHTV